ncbi:MAG: tetratricopeptide repeat protein, partial [bacterium]
MFSFQLLHKICTRKLQLSFWLIPVISLFLIIEQAFTQEVNPNAYSYYEKGMHANDLSEKIKFFEKALELEPEFKEATYQLGVTYYQKGAYNPAINYLNQTKALDSTAFTDINLYLKNAYTFLAEELNEQGEYDLALTTA